MIKKLCNNFVYSCNGLKRTFASESSFRMEVFAIPFLLLVLAFLPIPSLRKILMFTVYLIVPCLELLNSAIEKLADRITTDHDLAIGFAKDAASAAVMLGIILVTMFWVGCIFY